MHGQAPSLASHGVARGLRGIKGWTRGILRDGNQQYRWRGRRGTRLAAAALALLACACEAWALSAGSPSGMPLIGRPLELVIPVRWDRGETPPCVRAEFLQGESPGGPLTWRIDRTSETSGLLRLTSSLAVQEPVVTVQVALGCGEQLARQYVMLAEPPNQSREAQAAAAVAPQLPIALAPLALATSPMLGSAAAGPAAARSEADKSAAAAPPRRHRAPATNRAPAGKAGNETVASTPAAKTATVPGTGRARLKLEPIDVEIDEAPVLRLSNALTLPPAGAGSAGTGSAALPGANARDVFQALNTSPEQQAAQAQNARAVASELKAMRELVQRYGAESRAATQRLEKVSGERDLVLNVMIGIVVLFAAGLGYLLWLRTRESAMRQAWWEEEHGEAPARASKRAAAAAPVAAAAGAAVVAAAPEEQAAPMPGEAAGGVTHPEPDSGFIELPDFLSLDHSRVPTAEELLGLKERADFFLAVGQPDKAVHLLESQLHEHTGSSPFVWLDLLDLCRRLERREDYERLRVAFQKLFTARLPAFDAATPYSGGLEGHPRALSRITVLWHSPRVLKVIEESLFEEPKPGSITFDLEASRELLLLYGIASEVLGVEPEAAGAAGSSETRATPERFPDTMVTPLASASNESGPVPLGAAGHETEPVPLAALDHIPWPPSLLRETSAPAPLPRGNAAAPDIDLGKLDPFLADIDFDLPPPPRRRDGS